MPEKRKYTKIGLSQNWLGENRPKYFTKYTLLAIPFLLWELVKFLLWLLLAFCIVESLRWIFDYPSPPTANVWSWASNLLLAWVVRDAYQEVMASIRKRKSKRSNALR